MHIYIYIYIYIFSWLLLKSFCRTSCEVVVLLNFLWNLCHFLCHDTAFRSDFFVFVCLRAYHMLTLPSLKFAGLCDAPFLMHIKSYKTECRRTFRTLSKIHGGVFFCENSFIKDV